MAAMSQTKPSPFFEPEVMTTSSTMMPSTAMPCSLATAAWEVNVSVFDNKKQSKCLDKKSSKTLSEHFGA